MNLVYLLSSILRNLIGHIDIPNDFRYHTTLRSIGDNAYVHRSGYDTNSDVNQFRGVSSVPELSHALRHTS